MARWGRGVPALCRPAMNPRIWHELGVSSLSPLVLVGSGPLRGTPLSRGEQSLR